jgi:hypothetical protein
MGRRRGQTGAGGAVVSSISVNAGGAVRSKAEASRKNEAGQPSGKSKPGESASLTTDAAEVGHGEVGGASSEIVKSAGWIGKTPSIFLREWCTKHNRKRPK